MSQLRPAPLLLLMMVFALAHVACSDDLDGDDAEATQCQLDACSNDELCVDHQCVDNPHDDLTCDNLFERWDAFVAENQSCENDSDCTVVGGTDSCDCEPVLGGDVYASGTAIHRDAADASSIFFDKFESDECQDLRSSNQICDAAPHIALSCDDGTCRLQADSCFQ